MAANGADVLREFVVSLGWKVDEPQFKAMIKNVTAVATAVTEISAVVTAAAYVVDKYVTQMAQKMEKLYFQAERSGASVKSLEALEFGAQQIGFAAGQATSLIEGMTSAMRSSPGLAAMFGVTPGSDPTKNLLNIIGQFKKMDTGPNAHAIVAQYGAMFGMSEQDLVMYEKGYDDLKKSYDLRQKMFADAGMNPDAAAQESHMFDNRMRTLQASIEIVQMLLAERFMPAIDRLVDGIAWVAREVGKADKWTHGGSTDAIGIVGFLGLIGGIGGLVKVVAKIMGFDAVAGATSWGLLGKIAAKLGVGAGAGAEAGAGGLGGIVAALGGWEVILAAAAVALMAMGAGKIATFFGVDPHGHEIENWVKSRWVGNNPGNIGGGPGGRSYASAQDGLTAIASQMMSYFSKGSNTLDTLFAEPGRYSPRGKDNPNIDAALKRMGKDMRVDPFNTHLTPDANTLAALVHNVLINEHSKDAYGPAMISAAVSTAMARGAGARHFTSQTTVTVNGSGDPKAVGKAVGNEQVRVNADALRNLVPRTN